MSERLLSGNQKMIKILESVKSTKLLSETHNAGHKQNELKQMVLKSRQLNACITPSKPLQQQSTKSLRKKYASITDEVTKLNEELNTDLQLKNDSSVQQLDLSSIKSQERGKRSSVATNPD